MNLVDAGIGLAVLLVAGLAMRRGFAQVCSSLVGFLVTLVLAFAAYEPLAAWLGATWGWSLVWARPTAFVVLWLGGQIGYALGVSLFLGGALRRLERSPANRALAGLPGAAQGLLICALVVTVLALTPWEPVPGLRDEVRRSAVGGPMVRATLGVERQLAGIFAPAFQETLGFLTVRPEPKSGETIPLPVAVADAPPVPEDEEQLLNLMNAERLKAGVPPLVMEATLRVLARAYGRDLLGRAYFSHTSKEGLSPFERMSNAGVIYGAAGENLALAPTLEQAHSGLINSPGHRANILNPAFGKVGLGVLDGGVAGRMVVQEFTD